MWWLGFVKLWSLRRARSPRQAISSLRSISPSSRMSFKELSLRMRSHSCAIVITTSGNADLVADKLIDEPMLIRDAA